MKGLSKALTLAALFMSMTGIADGAQALEKAHFSKVGFQSELEMDTYLTIHDVVVKPAEAALTVDEAQKLLSTQPDTSRHNHPFSIVDDLAGIQTWITLGEKVWNLVVANKPVSNVSTQRIAVLPISQPNWQEMENWKGPAVKSFVIEAINGFGSAVISQTYTVAMNYGGQLDGKGAFLANATVIPTNIDVSWGFSLDSSIEVGEAINTSTKDNPTPGIDLQVKWVMDSVVSHSEGRDSFFVKGDGEITHINGGI